MQDYERFANEFHTVMENSFDKAFEHYKNNLIETVKGAGGSEPVVFVLELTRDKVNETDTAITVQGKTYYPDIMPVRDYIKKLGIQYIKGLRSGKKNIPASIIVGSEVYMAAQKLPKGKTPKDVKIMPLQDENGKSINGSVEKYMVSGMTANDKTMFAVYDIIRDDKGVITDLVIDENSTADAQKVEATILKNFYVSMANYLAKEKKDARDDLKGWSF